MVKDETYTQTDKKTKEQHFWVEFLKPIFPLQRLPILQICAVDVVFRQCKSVIQQQIVI
jgi:hypothetical protein